MGRTFLPEEEQPSTDGVTGSVRGARVVVLSYGTWRVRFGGEREIAGKEVLLDSEPYTVVGVMPEGFFFPDKETEVWVPQGVIHSDRSRKRTGYSLGAVVARLKEGVSLEQAQAEANSILERAPEDATGISAQSFHVVSYQDRIVENVKPALWTLQVSVGFVLLIACSNVGGLLLVRATDRERERAIRVALGAGRRALIRQSLLESGLLGAGGALLGLLLAFWGVGAVKALLPRDLSRANDLAVDGTVALFTIAVSIATIFFFGLAPALQTARVEVTEALKPGGSIWGRTPRPRLRSLLATAEIALAVVLLVGAGLLLQSFVRFVRTDRGYDPTGVLTFKIALPKSSYPAPESHVAFYRDFLERAKAIPSVRAVGISSSAPLVPGSFFSLSITTDGREEQLPSPLFFAASADYFAALGIPLLRGRIFSDEAGGGAIPVVINDTLARSFKGDPVGRVFLLQSANRQCEVVGVVKTTRDESLEFDLKPAAYLPYTRNFGTFITFGMAVAARTSEDPSRLAPAFRAAIQSLDRDLPLDDVRALKARLSERTAGPRFYAVLMGLFASAALLLAVLGLYGLISYSVSRRTREIGVRMALGAESRDVMRLVLSQGTALLMVGLVLGVLASLGLTRFISSRLFGVTPTDAGTFAAVVTLMAAVALLATFLPARRATQVDPLVALRQE